MSMFTPKATWLRTVLAAALIGLAYAAAGDDDHDRAKMLREAGDILPLQAILEQANRDQPGRIVEVELERKRGNYVYEVKIVDEKGKVHERLYDARTAAPVAERRKE